MEDKSNKQIKSLLKAVKRIKKLYPKKELLIYGKIISFPSKHYIVLEENKIQLTIEFKPKDYKRLGNILKIIKESL
jgi:hypothetical protein